MGRYGPLWAAVGRDQWCGLRCEGCEDGPEPVPVGDDGPLEEPEPLEEPGPLGELGPREGALLLLDEGGLPGLVGPLGPLALWLEGAELWGVLGLLTGLVGVPEGVLLEGVDGVLEPPDGELPLELVGPPGLVGPVGPPPEPPPPEIETIWPLGSKLTWAVHGPRGASEESTRMWIDVWAPPASMPEVALRVSQGASGDAVQLIGAVPEFQRVTSTSPGLFERCDTLMCSCVSPLGSCEGPEDCDGSGSTGPLKGRLLPTLGAEDAGVVGSTAATTCAATLSPPGSPLERALPATGRAGPASGLELGRG